MYVYETFSHKYIIHKYTSRIDYVYKINMQASQTENALTARAANAQK